LQSVPDPYTLLITLEHTMPLKPITFAKACKIVQKSLACIVDGDALTYPVINEDFDGNDVIETNWHSELGLMEFSFGRADEYYIDSKGVLEIHKDKGECYTLQFLEIVKVK
jgi:hypothetical protein